MISYNAIKASCELAQEKPEELAGFKSVIDQFEWRKGLILKALADNNIDVNKLSAVIGRGGVISPIESGVYEVNDDLRHDLLNARMQHASNLGGLLARDIADSIGVKSYIADPVVVDEMMPYARISGVPELPRESIFHALNQKAVARLFAKESDKKYEDLNLVVFKSASSAIWGGKLKPLPPRRNSSI